MRVAGDFNYEALGPGYGAQRRPDPRIAAFIHEALGGARSVLNVGAGTGSYEPDARYVLAVEPSAAMRAGRPRGTAPVINAVAEALPLDHDSVDAAMAVATVHQWPDLLGGLSEMRRVSRGPVVIVAFDGDALDHYWLNDYAPDLIAAEKRRYPPIDRIAAHVGAEPRIVPIPIPLDCSDGIIEAFYGRPERLLDPAVRRAQSSWGFIDSAAESRFVAALSADLASGRWDERHGALRTQKAYEGSLRLIVGEKPDQTTAQTVFHSR